MEVRDPLLCIVVVVPVRRGDHLPLVIMRLPIQGLVTLPCDPLVCHVVKGVRLPFEHGTADGVVEHGVRNQATRIVRLPGSRVGRQGRTHAARNRTVRQSRALQLLQLQGLNVSSMILVEVGETIVHEDRRSHRLGNIEREVTDPVVGGRIP